MSRTGNGVNVLDIIVHSTPGAVKGLNIFLYFHFYHQTKDNCKISQNLH